MTLTIKAASGARWSAVGSFFLLIFGLMQIVILTRLLSPEDFGYMAIVMVVVSIGDIFVNSSFSDAIVSKKNITVEQMSTLYFLNILLGFFLSILVFLLSPLIASVFNAPVIENYIKLVSFVFLISSTTVQFEAVLKKNLLFKPLVTMKIISGAIGFVVTISFAVNFINAWALVLGYLAMQISLSFMLFSHAYYKKWLPNLFFELNSIKEFIYFGGYRIGASFVNQVFSRVDQVVIGAILGTASLGIFSVVYQLVMQPFNRINPILTQISFPVFSAARSDNSKLSRGYCKGLRVLMAINSPILIGLAVISPQLIPIILGDKWADSVILVQVLAIFVLLKSAGNINIGLILAKEKYKWPFYWNILLLLIVPAVLISVGSYMKSLISICVALVLMQFVFLMLSYFFFTRRLLGRIGFDVFLCCFRPIFSAIIMTLIILLMQEKINFDSELIKLIVSVCIGFISYVGTVYLTQRVLFYEIYFLVFNK